MRSHLLGFVAAIWASAGAAQAESLKWTAIAPDSGPVFAGGNPYVQENSGKSWSLQQAKTQNAQAFRFEVRAGDQWAEDQASGENKERSELDGYKRLWSGKTPVWAAYWFLVEPGQAYKSDWTSISQMHGSEVRPFFVLFNDDELSVIGEARVGGKVSSERIYMGKKLTRGVWHNAVYELLQSSSADGSLRGWIDGVQVVDFHGPIGSDSNKAYWKFGVYRGYGPISTPFAIEYANVEVGNKDLSARIKGPPPLN